MDKKFSGASQFLSRFRGWIQAGATLLTYQNADGGFCHERGGETNLMASEQAACALASLVRAERGESSFYRMAALTQPAA